MAIVFAFMVPVDGWLTKLSAPIVVYREADVSGWRPVWDILAEEFAYAFALLTLVMVAWERAMTAAVTVPWSVVRRHGRGELRHPPVADARPGDGLARAATTGPRPAAVERNDLFPLCFSVVGFALFALGTAGPAWTPLVWVGVGVTAYGGAVPVRPRGVHPPPAPGARCPGRPLPGVVCAARTGSTTSPAASPTGCCCRCVPGPAERRAALEAAPAVLDRSPRARSTRSTRSRL